MSTPCARPARMTIRPSGVSGRAEIHDAGWPRQTGVTGRIQLRAAGRYVQRRRPLQALVAGRRQPDHGFAECHDPLRLCHETHSSSLVVESCPGL